MDLIQHVKVLPESPSKTEEKSSKHSNLQLTPCSIVMEESTVLEKGLIDKQILFSTLPD